MTVNEAEEDARPEWQTDVSRLRQQAQAIEAILREAGVGSCPLPEGVRQLADRKAAPPVEARQEAPADKRLRDGDARYLRGIVRAHRMHGGPAHQPVSVEVLERVLWAAGLYSGPVTIQEAEERVARIWGRERIISLLMRPDGGVDVNLTPVGLASDVRGRTFSAHRLDSNGHTACHTDCADLEDAHRVRP